MTVAQRPIRFLTAPDGVRLACTAHGEGPPLVFVRGWVSHLELLWARPSFRAYFEALGEHFRVIRYDPRGNGLSDRDAEDVSLDALVSDLETVFEAHALESAVVYAGSFGGPIAIAFAARHPERVSRLILDGTYARGSEIAPAERLKTYVDMFKHTPEVAGAAMSQATQPDATDETFRRSQATWGGITNVMAARLYELGFTLDVTGLLHELSMPVLVMHRRGSISFPFELGRRLAGRIPNASFVALDGRNHESWDGDAAPALAAVGEFLGVRLSTHQRDASGPALTILFTDMVGSPSLTQRLGDSPAHLITQAHNEIVRTALTRSSGREIKHTGDGIMASFDSATASLHCAREIQALLGRYLLEHPDVPFSIRIGLNAGEPVREQSDLFGTAVQLARRLCDAAEPGEALCSGVVRELAAGKGFAFEDRGELDLKGFDQPVRAWALRAALSA